MSLLALYGTSLWGNQIAISQTQLNMSDSSLTTLALKSVLQLVIGYSKSNTTDFAGFKPTNRAVFPIDSGFGAGAGVAEPGAAVA